MTHRKSLGESVDSFFCENEEWKVNIQKVSINVTRVSLPIETQPCRNLVQSNCPYAAKPGISGLYENHKKFIISRLFSI